jgi:hypothetical protein
VLFVCAPRCLFARLEISLALCTVVNDAKFFVLRTNKAQAVLLYSEKNDFNFSLQRLARRTLLGQLVQSLTNDVVNCGTSMRDVAIHSPTFSFPLLSLANYLRGSFRCFLFHSQQRNRVCEHSAVSEFPRRLVLPHSPLVPTHRWSR